MSFLAAKPAALPHLTPRALRALTSSLKTGNGSGEVPSFCGLFAAPLELGVWANFRSQGTDERLWSRMGQPFRIPSSTRSLLRGQTGALRLGVVCFGYAALQGLGSSQNKSCKRAAKYAAQTSPGPAKKALLGTWEPGPLARLRLV